VSFVWNTGISLLYYTQALQQSLGRHTGFSMSVVPVLCFPDIFWINFADNEIKLAMIVYNNELQIKFEFHHYWTIFALGLRIFMKISVFRTFFEFILQILKWNLVWLFTIMSYRSSLSFVIIDQYLTKLWPLD
jgi:hypothetical protein